jgi:hypothetical protein
MTWWQVDDQPLDLALGDRGELGGDHLDVPVWQKRRLRVELAETARVLPAGARSLPARSFTGENSAPWQGAQNNRAENSHQAVRRREGKLQRFKSCWMTSNTLSVAVTKPTMVIALISGSTQNAAWV